MKKHDYLWMLIHNEKLPADISNTEFNYEQIFNMSEKNLMDELGLHKVQARYILNAAREVDIDRKYDEFIKSGAKSVTINDDNYPERLRDIPDRPFGLIYYGELPKEDEKNVAIVGARACTEYGRVMAERLAVGLADKGVNIISGMALGIDGISQMGALNAGAKSYGVLGGGVDICYPRANRPVYERLKNEGGLISEYGLSVPAKAQNFPKRNRIISGLSDGVIVVQARVKSGTFITVDEALSQGREVMVVPGMVTDPLSVGCNMLIMQGAYPVQCADDVINIIGHTDEEAKKQKSISIKNISKQADKIIGFEKSEKFPLASEEKLVYSVLDFYAKSMEEVANAVNMEFSEIVPIFISLEMKGLIKECGKNIYVKCDNF